MAGVSCGTESRFWVEVEALAAVLRLDVDEGEPVRDIFQKARGMRMRRRSVWRFVELGV